MKNLAKRDKEFKKIYTEYKKGLKRGYILILLVFLIIVFFLLEFVF